MINYILVIFQLSATLFHLKGSDMFCIFLDMQISYISVRYLEANAEADLMSLYFSVIKVEVHASGLPPQLSFLHLVLYVVLMDVAE